MGDAAEDLEDWEIRQQLPGNTWDYQFKILDKQRNYQMTSYVTIKAFAQYAKVFPENRDMAENAKHPGVKKMLKAHEGQYSIDVYPLNEEELNKAFGPLSNEMYGGGERLKEGESSFGVGKYFTLKRKHKDVKDTKKGEIDFGGTPEVVHWTEDKKNTPWDFEADGAIGNGSEVVVKFSVYGEGTTQSVRLEKVGVVNHVPYEANGSTVDGEKF